VGVVGVSPPAEGVRGPQTSEKNHIYNAKSCMLVHSWFRKWAAADRRGSRKGTAMGEGWVGNGVTPNASMSEAPKSAEPKTLKASRGWEWGRGFPSPTDYGVWGTSYVSSPSGVRAKPWPRQRISVLSKCHVNASR